MKSGFLANFGYRCRILEVKKRKIIRISLGIHFWGLENATVRGSHGLSARRARRTKSRRPEGPKGGPKGHRLEVGARRAPKLLVPDICHLDHLHVGGEEICHVEKFQISIHGISPHEEEFQFFHTTDVEKCEFLPNLVKFHISPQDRCEEIWNLSSFLS